MSLISTPLVDNLVVDDAAHTLVDLHERISRLPDLRPSPEVDSLLTELVELVVKTPERVAFDLLEHPDVRAIAGDLRDLSGRAEAELEHAWARRITGSEEPQADVRRFPYLGNYRKLCRVEHGLIDAALDRTPASVAFLGCGPLPATALIHADGLGCEIAGIDRDRFAVDAAADVARALGLRDVRFMCGDTSAVDLSGFDVVLLAAMVGTTDAEKHAVLTQLRDSMRPDAVLLARSARGLRTLLYPPIDGDALTGFDVRAVVDPVSEVINSVVLARPAR